MTLSPPMGMMYLSGVLKKNGIQTELFDLLCQPKLRKKLLEECRKAPPLWIGLSALTPQIPATANLANEIKSINPKIPLILGGIHGSFLPSETLKEMPIDAVVIGEAEDRVLPLTELIASGRRDFWSIPQVAAKDTNDTICISRESVPLIDIKDIPLPDWDAINLHSYQRKVGQLIKRGKLVATIQTSRGCPFQCTFCATPNYYKRTFRKREPKIAVDEIQMLVKNYGVDEIQIIDDNFNLDLNHAKAVLKEIINRNLRIHWKAPQGFNIDSFDDEFIDLVVRSGGYQIGFGIESAALEVLRNVNRRINLVQTYEMLKKYKQAGISTFGNFILGLPGETMETAMHTINFAINAPLDHVHVALCIPYPGSAIFKEMDSKGLLHHRWGEYRHFNYFPVSELSVHQLKKLIRKFYFSFYLHPKRTWRLLSDMMHGHLLSAARIGRAYLRKRATC